ncbi:hypothetical protein M20_1562 [Lactococcus lactis subsp. lactis]|uniref:Uncharacterized protein n=1 Tax=Lactococcus lactis subsp. lactis TaxID=1360 RepID=A0A0V8E370_LACLL|nr:hypothetical protein M20_1562 [Lactococcus lactis subsp. lactis]
MKDKDYQTKEVRYVSEHLEYLLNLDSDKHIKGKLSSEI